MDDYRLLVQETVLDSRFTRAVFSGRRRGYTVPWKQVIIRPVLIRGERHLQFSYQDEKKDLTKNYTHEAAARLDELLDLAFSSVDLQTTAGAVQIQITRKGKAIVHRRDEATPAVAPVLGHDRHKNLLLPAGEPDSFLQAMGIMTRDGKIRARMQSKFRQINEFLKLAIETGEWTAGEKPLSIVDCGCGKAYLTLAIFHYLNHILGVPVLVTGIDVNQELIEKQEQQWRELGWEGLRFVSTPIIEFQPPAPPDMVLALHACDTATDEALAQAVKWQSRTILAVPCCHHHLQQQMTAQAAPALLHPVLRHGVLRQRVGDILTDALRAQILRIMGYRCDVVEFVSPEYTAKNLMLRATATGQPGDPQAVAEYKALCAFWQVTPFLETLLRDELVSAVIHSAQGG